ncbi:hypothetical protein MTYP_01894 [Methylophilaceae bacterium]|nr:hypothetical protein MTYP_01894 [Methylophilaceae bacterium]
MKKSVVYTAIAATGAAAVMLVPELAMAASQLPATALDTVGTDAIDTAKDISVKFIPVVVGMAISWFILSGTKKGLGKSGIK